MSPEKITPLAYLGKRHLAPPHNKKTRFAEGLATALLGILAAASLAGIYTLGYVRGEIAAREVAR